MDGGLEAVLNIAKGEEKFGSMEEYVGMLETLHEHLPERLAEVESFFEGRNREGMLRATRKLQGVIPYLEAQAFTEANERLMRLAQSVTISPDELIRARADFERESKRAMAAVARLIAEHHAAAAAAASGAGEGPGPGLD